MRSTIPFAAILAAVIVSGCTVSNAPMAVGDAVKFEVLSYSNPMLEPMLTGFNSGNYSMFSEKFSQAMMKQINQDAFEQLRSRLQTSIGKYVSRGKDAEVMEVGGYYRVTYTAQFTEENPVHIILVFNKGDSSHLLEDLRFTSKKLTGTI